MQYLEAEEKIREQKQLHEGLLRRGVDFLTEMELGNAPPIEYVAKNIHVDQAKVKKSMLLQSVDHMQRSHFRLSTLSKMRAKV